MALTAGVPRFVRITLGVAGALVVAAVLAAVIVPTFLGVTTNAGGGREAESNLTNALTVVAARYQAEGSSYSGVTPVLLNASDPEFSWVADGPTVGGPVNTISTDSCADGPACQAIVLAAYEHGTGVCWEGVIALTRAAALAAGVPKALAGREGGTFYGNTRGAGPCLAGTPGHPQRPGSGWATDYSALPQT